MLVSSFITSLNYSPFKLIYDFKFTKALIDLWATPVSMAWTAGFGEIRFLSLFPLGSKFLPSLWLWIVLLPNVVILEVAVTSLRVFLLLKLLTPPSMKTSFFNALLSLFSGCYFSILFFKFFKRVWEVGTLKLYFLGSIHFEGSWGL